MVQLYIFRHGETDWNAQDKFQGHTDIPLNEKGTNQAKDLREKLLSYHPEMIICSDLTRARQTCDLAFEGRSFPVQYFEELRECFLGHTEGMRRDDIIAKFGEEVLRSWASSKPEDQDFALPGGESKRALLYRVKTCIESFVEANPTLSRLAVSTHGGAMRRLLQNCHGAPADLYPIPNCGLYLAQFNRKDRGWHFGGAV